MVEGTVVAIPVLPVWLLACTGRAGWLRRNSVNCPAMSPDFYFFFDAFFFGGITGNIT